MNTWSTPVCGQDNCVLLDFYDWRMTNSGLRLSESLLLNFYAKHVHQDKQNEWVVKYHRNDSPLSDTRL